MSFIISVQRKNNVSDTWDDLSRGLWCKKYKFSYHKLSVECREEIVPVTQVLAHCCNTEHSSGYLQDIIAASLALQNNLQHPPLLPGLSQMLLVITFECLRWVMMYYMLYYYRAHLTWPPHKRGNNTPTVREREERINQHSVSHIL